MAFRIAESVVRGEIDNRVKGTVRGRIWVENRPNPIILDLRGNACLDVAGCLLTFTNPVKRTLHPHLDTLGALQSGSAGDITASRKVRVFDIPFDEAYMMLKRKEKPPEHTGNCVYIEWFSVVNGRVVIESTEFEISVSAAEWRLTADDELERAKLAAAGMGDFLQRLTDAIDKHKKGQKTPEEKWDEHDFEKLLKECDARTDKYAELLDKYGDSDEAQELIDAEMGWGQDAEEEAEADEATRYSGGDEDRISVEEMNAICEEAANSPEPEPDPAREGIDWIRTEKGDIEHPLYWRTYTSMAKFRDAAEAQQQDNPAVDDFIFEFQRIGAKLTGALSPYARGGYTPEPAFTVAYLKRALNYLHSCQRSLQKVADEKAVSRDFIKEATQELLAIREEILKLMDRFRQEDRP